MNPTESKLSDLCYDYNHGKYSGTDFVTLVTRYEGEMGHKRKLLLKRVERTCGRHFCKLWHACDDGCVYQGASTANSLSWNDEIVHYASFDDTRGSDPAQDSPRRRIVRDSPMESQPQDSGGFIICHKDNVVQSAKAVSDRKAALQDALKHMMRFSLQQQPLSLEALSKVSNKRTREERDQVIEEKQADDKTPRVDLCAQVIPFRTVPVVDLSLPVDVVASKIGEACRLVGFFYIVNHGVSKEMTDLQFDWAKRFFSLPSQAKHALDCKKSKGGIRGYFALGQENLNTAKGETLARYHGDFKEGFDVGYETSDAKNYEGFKLAGTNLWPSEEEIPTIVGFRRQCQEYYKAMLALGRRLMKCFAIALKLPEEFFEQCLEYPLATLRMLHYPPQHPSDTMNKIGCGAHTDYGCCTILLQDATGGLQVRNSKMQWIHAPPVAGSYIINIGDMMSRWTNNVFASTVHRVLNSKMPQRDRYSIPFFLNPRFDTEIKCLDTCVEPNRPAAYEPSTCEDILMKRYVETFDHLNKKKDK